MHKTKAATKQIKRITKAYNYPKFHISLLVLFTMIGLVSCEQYYHQEQLEVNNEVWKYADSLTFHFDIKDTTYTYDLLLDIEHHKDYLYENLYCKIYTYAPNVAARQQQISFQLADKMGVWKGDCSGDYCTATIALLTNTTFNTLGQYKIVLEQFTRQQDLEGLKSFQLKIKQLNKR